MTPGYQALTEKEKETLRLLVCGYDAKSMARHLGLSVHTINERLRDARRKMATSSSREAARQLREVEGESPQSLGDKQLGDAPASDAAQAIPQPAQGDGNWCQIGWIVGGLVMTFSLALLALSALSGPTQAPANPPTATSAVLVTPASEKAVTDAARQFLLLLDRDDWSASWQATHQSFKLLNTVEWWSQASNNVRGKVGPIKSRELMTVDFAPAPPNGYWTVKFRASYGKKASVIETLSLASEDGGWKVVGITVE
jgi:DNA-binding CsgD family transcriptional regulator